MNTCIECDQEVETQEGITFPNVVVCPACYETHYSTLNAGDQYAKSQKKYDEKQD